MSKKDTASWPKGISGLCGRKEKRQRPGKEPERGNDQGEEIPRMETKIYDIVEA